MCPVSLDFNILIKCERLITYKKFLKVSSYIGKHPGTLLLLFISALRSSFCYVYDCNFIEGKKARKQCVVSLSAALNLDEFYGNPR